MRFGGLLHMPETCLRRNMILELANTNQVSNQSFNICDQYITINLEDVSNIMGLVIEGYDVDKYVKETMQNDDLKRAFVLFIIGVVLTTITQIHVHWSYIQSQFTLTHLLDLSYNNKTRKQMTLQGNLVLLQYDKIIQPPLMVFYNETNAIARTNAFLKERINGGTVSFQT
ncbi:hypothetical protein BDA96_10G263200 [Sorghum bicolor]|uniref:Uncharacterized protein n=1 Tax=Sorghum bicolor TaxID=4558 RepID=A0A921U263_SORBI|nr:hypothetical protein BDA96_10G263200 [Sorghum bicolor]